MEMIEIIWQWLLSGLARMTTVLVLIALAVGIYLFFEKSKKYKRLGVEAIATSIALGAVILMARASAEAYGANMFNGLILFILYYALVIGLLIRAVLFVRSQRKK